MKLGIMQPYFFPYIGYFSLIKHTDRFILLDKVQFIYHGWIERNRILKPVEGWQYIKIPLQKRNQKTLISEILINNDLNWKGTLIAQLQHYKKPAPFYYPVINLIQQIFSKDFSTITELNADILRATCNYLGIQKKIEIFSELNIELDQVNEPDEWALNICKAIGGVDEYWNPPGGVSFFDKSKYDKCGIGLKFQIPAINPYNQKRQLFESSLSIIDVMMFNSAEEINFMLDQYELV